MDIRFSGNGRETTGLSSIDEIIEDARNGRMFVLVDDEDRENEGDLVIPAQMATPESINFMASHGRGLICLALTRQRVDQLGLQPMSARNRTRLETAFTTSIEAKHGIKTGISAADRARTIAVAIDAARSAEDLVMPGHVFPLVARDGGVLVRAGHTEAAVDVARLAGLNASGVICEIMNDDGTMARMDDLLAFSQRHGLKVGTIRDLIAYRRRNDHLVERRVTFDFESHWGGSWTAATFFNKATTTESVALVKGRIDDSAPTLVRMHSLSPFADAFAEVSERYGTLARAMQIIDREGAGIVVIINQPLTGMSKEIEARSRAARGEPVETGLLRDYGFGAQVLAELGVHDIVLLTNSPNVSMIGLAGYGLSIVGERPIDGLPMQQG